MVKFKVLQGDLNEYIPKDNLLAIEDESGTKGYLIERTGDLLIYDIKTGEISHDNYLFGFIELEKDEKIKDLLRIIRLRTKSPNKPPFEGEYYEYGQLEPRLVNNPRIGHLIFYINRGNGPDISRDPIKKHTFIPKENYTEGADWETLTRPKKKVVPAELEPIPEQPAAKETEEEPTAEIKVDMPPDFKALRERLTNAIERVEHDLGILENNKKFEETTVGAEMVELEKQIELIKRWTGEEGLATFLKHFMTEKGKKESDFTEWIRNTLKDPKLADEIQKEEKALMKITKWAEEWEKVTEHSEKAFREFLKSPDVHKVARTVHETIVASLEKKVERIKKWREDKTKELQKAEGKAKSVIEDIFAEGTQLLDRGKELDTIQDEVLRNIEENRRINRWILTSIPKIEKVSDDERVKGWEELHKGVVAMKANSQRNIEIARTAAEEAKALEKDTKKEEKRVPQANNILNLLMAAAAAEQKGIGEGEAEGVEEPKAA
ncbi:hypothetical protein KY331_06500 [Candidatus Woesearchaeota archaeon]|nr:hypothetical protein [Candidatus Woesearchaeota archaeon]